MERACQSHGSTKASRLKTGLCGLRLPITAPIFRKWSSRAQAALCARPAACRWIAPIPRYRSRLLPTRLNSSPGLTGNYRSPAARRWPTAAAAPAALRSMAISPFTALSLICRPVQRPSSARMSSLCARMIHIVARRLNLSDPRMRPPKSTYFKRASGLIWAKTFVSAAPALNILAMRRNQEVEVGLQVRGTTRAPRAQLVSEPNVPDTEKLSWLLFRHGTDKGATVGQQYAKNAALAFLGSMGGKQIAQRIGLDELSISQSEIGLTDPQVITLAKALNRHFILGYEEGLSSSAHIFKVTWQFWRS